MKTKWKFDGCYCPSCGKERTVVQDSSGDYYLGPAYMCLDCGEAFYLSIAHGDFYAADLEELRRTYGQADNKDRPS